MEWQPIETAMTDGTWLILYGDMYGEPEVHAGFWGGDDDPDWYGSECASRSLTAFDWKPTHWMPLPKPPASTAE
jgi:hypothetical protein